MRIVSYNILEGGVGRADPLAEILLAQRADIVALVEADDPGVVDRIASRLKMDYIHATAGRTGAALLSRYHIVETIDHAALAKPVGKALLEAVVSSPDSGQWTVGVVHLTHGAYQANEQQRQQELAVVLDIFAEHRRTNRPHLLVGDFNANAPYQQIDPERCKPSTRQAWHANGQQIPRRVVQMLLDAGYIDALYAVDPGGASTAASFTTLYPGQRVDYIFVFSGSAAAKITRAWIEQDRLAKYASDHFPVGAEIEVDQR